VAGQRPARLPAPVAGTVLREARRPRRPCTRRQHLHSPRQVRAGADLPTPLAGLLDRQSPSALARRPAPRFAPILPIPKPSAPPSGNTGPTPVVHFAASAYVGESMVNPRKYFRNNVVNSLNLLDVMLEEGVDTIVFSSSCATYGIPAVVPISEDSPQQPSNPYGESKLFVEKALRAFGGAYSLHWAALRYFNAAGADPDGDLGEDHDPEPHLISRVIAAALDPGIVVDVFGADYPTPDGTAVRDYVHVCDLADAHLLALDCLWGGAE